MTPIADSAVDPVSGSRGRSPILPVAPSRGRLQPLGLDEVVIEGGYWGQRQERNRAATLAHVEGWLERAGWLGNFDAARDGRLPAARRGREFSDTEVYKLLEAMAWELGRAPDPELQGRFDAIVARVAAAQEPDGYLNTNFGRPGQGPRWSDLEWGHELYSVGHLLQAAVARARTGSPDDLLVTVACRAADLVCEVFGDGGIERVGGHAEIEPALVELSRATGERRYLDQARRFVARRGTHVLADVEFGRSYYQDDVPIRDADVLRGHVVRAMYLSSGAVDLAMEDDDADLLGAVTRQFRRTVARRTYLTGGMGSHHQDEAFGDDFVLPPDRAYSETCGGVGAVMVAWRLLLAHGDATFADLVERVLFNVVSASPSAEGTAFFYANTLHQRDVATPAEVDEPSPRAASSLRAPWFEVSCCPTNVARTMASLAAYVATRDHDGVQLHQYVPGSIRTSLDDGRAVALRVATDYPRSGTVRVEVEEGGAGTWTLSLRVPSWADAARLQVDGVWQDVGPGSTTVRRDWQVGDTVVLDLPMTPRFVRPDPRIDAVRGCLAVQRGPEVLCVESVDLPSHADLERLRVDPVAAPREREDGRVVVSCRRIDAVEQGWPYAAGAGSASGNGAGTSGALDAAIEVPLTPYHDWANRGPTAMRVWLPTT